MTATLAALAPKRQTLEIDGVALEISALRLSDVAALLSKHASLAAAFGSGDLAGAILTAGPGAIGGVIEAATRGAVSAELGAELDAVVQGLIVVAAIDLTLPADEGQLDFFLQRLLGLMGRVGAIAGRVRVRAATRMPP